jgi:Family of unknown function (DUF6500)
MSGQCAHETLQPSEVLCVAHQGASLRRTSSWRSVMRAQLRQKIIEVCDLKVKQKGKEVGHSFCAFFANKNDDPDLLMEAATWWIQEQRLDHFEKATKIRNLVEGIE